MSTSISSPAERPQFVVPNGTIVGQAGQEDTPPGRGVAHSRASIAVVCLLPLGALLMAFATTGATRSLSRQYLQTVGWSLVLIIAFACLEKVFPAPGPRKRSHQVILNIQSGLLVFLAATVAGVLSGWVTSVVGRHLEMGWIDLGLRSADNLSALIATALLTWLTYDFVAYWYHRSQHTFAILWQIHKFHHMDEQFSVTTRLRDNVSDVFVSVFSVTLPIALLFHLDPGATAKLGTFMGLWGEAVAVFIHANIRLHFGWVNALIVTHQVHRIHHSRLIQHHNKNFCVYLPIWDIVFGTYFHPSREEFPPSGTDEAGDVSSIREVIALPFHGWWAISRGWWQGRDAGAFQ